MNSNDLTENKFDEAQIVNVSEELRENPKTYVLIVSKNFMKTHPKAGQPTYFDIKLKNALFNYPYTSISVEGGPDILIEEKKEHTLRANFELWKKRIDEVNAGIAVLSIRQWTGEPRKSQQTEILKLTSESGLGVQKLQKVDLGNGWFIDDRDSYVTNEILAQNDGLSLEDFDAWFKQYDLSEPLAIIHFTNFRY